MIRDILCKVDGVSVEGQPLDAVCDRIRGPEGTPVLLEFRRVNPKKRGWAQEGLDGTFAVTLVRGGEPLPILEGNEHGDAPSLRAAAKITAQGGSILTTAEKRKEQGMGQGLMAVRATTARMRPAFALSRCVQSTSCTESWIVEGRNALGLPSLPENGKPCTAGFLG